jgi:hypothetical protein
MFVPRDAASAAASPARPTASAFVLDTGATAALMSRGAGSYSVLRMLTD